MVGLSRIFLFIFMYLKAFFKHYKTDINRPKPTISGAQLGHWWGTGIMLVSTV